MENYIKHLSEKYIGMNGDQGMMKNNAFPNIPIKNHHSQGIIIPSHSFFL